MMARRLTPSRLKPVLQCVHRQCHWMYAVNMWDRLQPGSGLSHALKGKPPSR